MSKTIKESVLFRTSAGTDVQCSGREIKVAGLKSVSKKDITGIYQVTYKAEVAQVSTVDTSAITPVASTLYQVVVYDPIRTTGGVNNLPKIYSYKTPSPITILGGSAALQREAINAVLITKINNDDTCHATAVTSGSGNGFTVTDDGGYYPVYSQSMTNIKGVNSVYTVNNADGSGFVGDEASVTTTAVYSYGSGEKLLAEKPVISYVFGNLISGVLDAPPLTSAGLPAVSGQNYDGFVITSLKSVSIIGLTGQYGYQDRLQTIFVDNGTGTSTTNLSGFQSFERAMLSLIFDQYSSDPSVIITMGNTAAVSQGLATGLPSGVAQAENVVSFGNGFSAHYSPIATSTLLALVSTNSGLGLVLDATASEGVELSAPTWANSQKSFVVGKTAFSIYAKITLDDASGVNPMWVGFRKKAAYGATFTSYSDYAVIGIGNTAGQIYTNTEKNSAGNTATDTTDVWADTETHTLEVRVDINGACTFYVDGYKPTVTQSFTLDSGDEMIPCIYALQTADLATPSLLELAALPTDSWRS